MPWQGVDPIRPDYRRSLLKAHAIYYQIAAEQALIVRILGRENPATSLPDADRVQAPSSLFHRRTEFRRSDAHSSKTCHALLTGSPNLLKTSPRF